MSYTGVSMSSVQLGEYGELTKTMMMDAVNLISQPNQNLKEVEDNPVYSDRSIRAAVDEHQDRNKRIQARARYVGVSDTEFLNAVKVVIKERQKLIFFLHPLRKYIPKFLLKEIPLGPLSLIEKDMSWLRFLDIVTSRFRRI